MPMRLLYPFLYIALLTASACAGARYDQPPKRWPGAAQISEISGLDFRRSPTSTARASHPQQTKEVEHYAAYAHNDSGDGPFLYQLPAGGDTLIRHRLQAPAVDYEDMTQDPQGNCYIGDFGNNRRNRTDLAVYRFQPETGQTDRIAFSYPGGRQHDCEAMVYQGGHLHLFTKAPVGRPGQYWSYHYRLPARPGHYTAQLVDSLYLPRRVVTAAAVDSLRGELLLTTYNYKRLLGFFPLVASSTVWLDNYPEGRYFKGDLRRYNLSWAIPNQVEGVAFYDDRYYYLAREQTGPRQARIRRKKRR